jgi:hypothetical protein
MDREPQHDLNNPASDPHPPATFERAKRDGEGEG